MLSVHHEKKSIKQHQLINKNKKKKPTKKPVKVVYISNPMKVNTSASEFSALVQELTGQDADVPDASKFSPEFERSYVGGIHQQEVPDSTDAAVKVAADQHVAAAETTYDDVPNNVYPSTYEFDNFGMLENNFIPGFEPSNLWYDEN